MYDRKPWLIHRREEENVVMLITIKTRKTFHEAARSYRSPAYRHVGRGSSDVLLWKRMEFETFWCLGALRNEWVKSKVRRLHFNKKSHLSISRMAVTFGINPGLWGCIERYELVYEQYEPFSENYVKQWRITKEAHKIANRSRKTFSSGLPIVRHVGNINDVTVRVDDSQTKKNDVKFFFHRDTNFSVSFVCHFMFHFNHIRGLKSQCQAE